MASTSNASTTSSTWNGLPLWPFAILERMPALAPNNLDQQINPGWTFGNLISVTEQNSTSPDTERAIVAAHSYGRQLGRVIDVIAELIDDLPETQRQSPAFRKFAELQADVEKIKSRSAARRLDRFVADLEELRQTNKTEYQRVATEVRAVLDR
jgi:hypothetical protein